MVWARGLVSVYKQGKQNETLKQHFPGYMIGRVLSDREEQVSVSVTASQSVCLPGARSLPFGGGGHSERSVSFESLTSHARFPLLLTHFWVQGTGSTHQTRVLLAELGQEVT